MSRLFDDVLTESLSRNDAVLSAVPLAMVCWFNSDSLTTTQCLMSITDDTSENNQFSLDLHGTVGGDPVSAQVKSVGGAARADSSSGYSADTWHSACAIFVSSTDRRAFIDGGSKGTNNTDITPADLNVTSIGALVRATTHNYISGNIAEAAIYDLSVWPGATASDKADNFEKILPSLAKTYTPKHYSLGRVAYWDLVRNLNDETGGYNLTANGTTVSNHPPVINPTKSLQRESGSINITPNALALQATLQAPTIVIDCTVTPSTLELTATLQTPTINYDYTVILGSELDLTLALQEFIVSIFYPDIPFFMQEDLIDPYSGGAWLWLVEIVVAGQTTQRIARNTENIVYDGDTFDRFNFDVSPQMFSSEGDIPRVTLRVFQDINRRVEDIINNAEGALGGQIKLIRVNEKFLDTPVRALEYDYDNLASQSDTEWVVFTLGMPNPLTQRIPLDTYNSSICSQATPTLFKGSRCQYAGDDISCTGTYNDCRGKDNAEHWGGELGLDPNVMRI